MLNGRADVPREAGTPSLATRGAAAVGVFLAASTFALLWRWGG
jgi:hypothetical protein